MTRYTRSNVHDVVAVLSTYLTAMDLMPEGATHILVQEGSTTNGVAWGLSVRTPEGERPFKIVDLSGAYSAREAYNRIRQTIVALQYIESRNNA